MKQRMNALYRQDSIAVIALLGILWAIMFYMTAVIVKIVPAQMIKIAIVLGGVSAVAFATASAIAVLTHLKRNQEQVYTQELTSDKDL